MTEFIGLDLGKDTCTVVELDSSGKVSGRESVPTTRRLLRRYFGRRKGCRLLLEVGCESGWVAREAEAMGLVVRCVNPRRLKLVAQTTLKTDELDAEVLARLCRLSKLDEQLLPAVRQRSEVTQQERGIMVVRSNLVKARTQLINTARGLARTLGHPLPSSSADCFVERARHSRMPARVRAVIGPVIDAVEKLDESLRQQEEQVARLAAKHPVVQHLMTIDGVGTLTALWFVLCIEDPVRFERPRDVGPYFGLRPRLRQSSSMRRTGSITKEGDAEMRRLLIQAAHCLLRSKRDSALKKWGAGLVRRAGRKKALPAIARKLAVVMLRLWQTGEVYEPFPGRAAA